MGKYCESRQISISLSQCKNYQQLLYTAGCILCRQVGQLKIYFMDENGYATEIESDADVLGLKYVAKTNQISLKIDISMSEQEIQNQLIKEKVQDFLNFTYEFVAKFQAQKEMRNATESYLANLYEQIAQKELKFAQIEEEEVDKYFAKMTSNYLRNHNFGRIVASMKNNQPNMKKTNNKQVAIQQMISKILQQMMPQMVKDLSSRIMQELSKNKSYNGCYDREQNPQFV